MPESPRLDRVTPDSPHSWTVGADAQVLAGRLSEDESTTNVVSGFIGALSLAAAAEHSSPCEMIPDHNQRAHEY